MRLAVQLLKFRPAFTDFFPGKLEEKKRAVGRKLYRTGPVFSSRMLTLYDTLPAALLLTDIPEKPEGRQQVSGKICRDLCKIQAKH